MDNKIININHFIPGTDRRARINLEGRNLILTGVNGCGKTRFLESLFEYIFNRIATRRHITIETAREHLRTYKNQLQFSSSPTQRHQYQELVDQWETILYTAENIPAGIPEIDKFSEDYSSKAAILATFAATRQADIRPSISSKSKETIEQDTSPEMSAANVFEEYLVNQKTAQAFAESPNIGNNLEEANLIKCWFTKLESDLQELFEDETLTLVFNPKKHNFLISQQHKSAYSFQQLSSGFSAILSIYADIMMKINFASVPPEAFYGIVFIDEIDAHLHVSLQRKIFSFLAKSFPQIQFIVSTHSPFVVSSVNDAIIYDLSTLEQVDDLSMYSYESILSGLFNTLPISEVLKNKIIELSTILREANPSTTRLRSLISEIGEHEKVLDSESIFFLNQARIVVSKSTRVEWNV
ncbi:ATP-binding protein [Pseudomonas syringae]|uniref:AAA family ATPase n=1 Tax=Pseudomonas syringae TaxID=317 RepID=UPI001BD16E6F|nr:AAA family ATPase [Pseudomonas syringae]MBS7472173.1 ATP-binding protein [Pseudomonas syringae]